MKFRYFLSVGVAMLYILSITVSIWSEIIDHSKRAHKLTFQVDPRAENEKNSPLSIQIYFQQEDSSKLRREPVISAFYSSVNLLPLIWRRSQLKRAHHLVPPSRHLRISLSFKVYIRRIILQYQSDVTTSDKEINL